MSNQQQCSRCGASLPADAPAGNCPACLLNIGLASGGEGFTVEAVAFGDRQFGRYELLEKIGAGGMGIVYRAHDPQLKRTVALKIIRSGEFASPQEVERFKREAEAAAGLDHPNVVPVYEVGETEGRHFLCLKLVEGSSLDSRMSEYQKEPRAAAALLAKVARAVHHAHQRGVLHRDLKPSNILVDSGGDPHITDFGLAKRVGQDSGVTLTGQLVGTPAYMAPEQARGGAGVLTAAGDVYSLGVILYEMLTGQVPFRADTPWQTVRMVAEMDPKPPRMIRPAANRDLETICLRCLEKNPQLRYDSALALAQDLERWLRREPILARRSGVWNRSVKWMQRHPAPALLIAALVLGTAASSWLALKATRARIQAESAALKARQIASFLESMLEGVAPGVAMGRDTALLRSILDITADRISADLGNHPDVEAELRSTLGSTYLKLGEYDRAESMTREALRLRQAVFGKSDERVAESQTDLARALINRRRGDDCVEAERLLRQALATLQDRPKQADLALAQTLGLLGSALIWLNQFPEAEVRLRESLAMRRQILGDHPLSASSCYNLAVVLERENRLKDAEAAIQEGLAIQKKVFGGEHPDIADSLGVLANILQRQGKTYEAEQACRQALEMRRQLLPPEHPMVLVSVRKLAEILRAQTREAEAEELYREEVERQRKAEGANRPEESNSLADLPRMLARHPEAARTIIKELEGLSGQLRNRAQFSDLEIIDRAHLAIRKEAFGVETQFTVNLLNQMSRTLRLSRKTKEAEAVCRESLALQRKLLAQNTNNSLEVNRSAAESLSTLASEFEYMGKVDDSIPVWREALAIARNGKPEDFPELLTWSSRLVQLLRQRDKLGESEQLLVEMVKWARAGTNISRLGTALSVLTQTLLLQGRFAEAEGPAKESQKLLDQSMPDTWQSFAARSMVGASLLGQKRFADAEPLLRAGFDGLTRVQATLPGSERSCMRESLERLLSLYRETGNVAGASNILKPFCRQFLALGPFPTTGLPSHGLDMPFIPETQSGLPEDRNERVLNWRVVGSPDPILDLGKEYGQLSEYLVYLAAEVASEREQLAEVRLGSDDGCKLWLNGTLLLSNPRGARVELDQEMIRVTLRQGTNFFLLKVSNQALGWAAVLRLTGAGGEPLSGIEWGLPVCRAAGEPLFKVAARLQKEGKPRQANVVLREACYRERLQILRDWNIQDEATLASVLGSLAPVLLDAGKFSEAESAAREWLLLREQKSGDHWQTFAMKSVLGGCLVGQGKLTDAEPLLVAGYEGLKQRKERIPENAGPWILQSLHRLLNLYEILNRPEKASHYQAEINQARRAEVEQLRARVDAGDIAALNVLAWMLATCGDASLRNGVEAIKLAEKAVSVTSRTNAAYLDTLAAARAETGDFTGAVRTQKEALKLATTKAERAEFGSRLRLYETNTPYRETR